MKRFVCMMLLLLALAPPVMARAADPNQVLRIGLAYGSSAVSSVTLSCAGGFSLGAMNGTTFSAAASTAATSVTVTAAGGAVTVSDSAGTALYTGQGQAALRAGSGRITYAGNEYNGDFVLTSEGSSLTVLNYVGLDDYVKGVLPYEMSASWPVEALKAQALCARSYALGNLGKHERYGFDLCNTTNCQVYRGVSQSTENSDAAVDQTAGQTLMADGELAVGYFFSSDGGATESNENVWGGTPISYLRGVVDPYEDYQSASNGVWSVTLTADEVASALQSAGYAIGTVADVQVTGRTDTGNVNQVTVTDTAGQTAVLQNSAVRSVFGLNSIRYTINGVGSTDPSGGTDTPEQPDGQTGQVYVNGAAQDDGEYYAVGGDGTSSAIGAASGKTALTASGQETIDLGTSAQTRTAASHTPTARASGTYTFDGTGWGHSVGMSQYGALAMAQQGFNYEQIVQFYFTGVLVVSG